MAGRTSQPCRESLERQPGMNYKDSPSGVPLKFDGNLTADSLQIRRFEEVPDVMTMEIPSIDWIVDGMIARGTITLWAGAGGTAKSFLAQKMGIAVATGSKFLGRDCKLTPTLYLDYENPAYAVRARLELMADSPIETLKVWGTWLEQQPPPIGSERLKDIVKQAKPLVIVDPFRFSHSQDENDSTAMSTVMRELRSYAAAGSAVVILHHLAKTEGSTGRGSTAIRDHSDVAFVQEISAETQLITLKGSKNRFGELLAVTIRPDFDAGTFEVTNSAQFTKRAEELEKLREIIAEQPGLSQNALYKIVGGKKETIGRRLKAGVDKYWTVTDGAGKAMLYHPMEWLPEKGTTQGTTGTTQTGNGTRRGDSLVPPLYKGELELRSQSHLPTTSSVSSPEKRTNLEIGTTLTRGGAIPDDNTSLPEKLCSKHGFHVEWFPGSGGVRVCAKCHADRGGLVRGAIEQPTTEERK
jgi:hypothetical protein